MFPLPSSALLINGLFSLAFPSPSGKVTQNQEKGWRGGGGKKYSIKEKEGSVLRSGSK